MKRLTKKSLTIPFTLIAICLLFQNCGQSGQITQELASLTPLCRNVDAAEIKPKLKWDWYSQLIMASAPRYENFEQVMASPVVAKLDGGPIPRVVFVSFSAKSGDWYSDSTENAAGYNRNGVLRIVDGKTGQTLKSIGQPDSAPLGTQTPLLMDIDGDGKVEIFYIHYKRDAIVALNYDGSFRWKYNLGFITSFSATGLTGSDVNSDGRGEILLGSRLITENNLKSPILLRSLENDSQIHRTTLAMPLDPSNPNVVHLVNNVGIYNPNGRLISRVPAGAEFFAAADVFPEIPGLEIVATGSAQRLFIINGLTGQVIKDSDLSLYNDLKCPSSRIGGGPPTIGDFEPSTKELEIAVATGRHLTLFDRDGKPLFKYTTQDCSSLVTGITSFDLNGDKKPEILYGDEEYLRIFESRNGAFQIAHQFVNPSGTLFEYPLVVDVDGNQSAELLVVSNNYAANLFYKDAGEIADAEEAKTTTGLRAFVSTGENAWMPTRSVWNQYSFHPDLVTDNAFFIPSPKVDGGYFRRNNQGYSQNLGCRNE